LQVFYTIEQMMRSKILRDAVNDGLELHGAILNSQTGMVDFLGEHPALSAFTDESRYV
jgi:hypothetical protein